jgi:hypothetical protein
MLVQPGNSVFWRKNSRFWRTAFPCFHRLKVGEMRREIVGRLGLSYAYAHPIDENFHGYFPS